MNLKEIQEEKNNCILVDVRNRKVLDILPNRKYYTLSDYFRNENREKAKYFVSDMWKPYEKYLKHFSKELNL